MENHTPCFNLLFLVLFISQVLCTNAYSNKNCIKSERIALLGFKKGLIDKSNRLSSWTGENCCTWEGIGCNINTGRVVKIDLHNPIVFDEYRFNFDFKNYDNFQLGGTISSSLLNLKYLQYMDLSGNDFSGIQIPPYFGSFKYMRYLNLSRSYFYGQIPTNLGNLSKLEYLDLGSDDYHLGLLNSKSLWWITTLSTLKSLDLSWVNIREANDWLQAVNMLPSLLSLNLQHCELVKYSISSYINFTSLVSLDLSYNSFNTSFPFFLFNASSIEGLKLDSSGFYGKLPNMFQKLTSLTKLGLSWNTLESQFPNSLCNLINLSHIDFTKNSFQGNLPFCFRNLTSLLVLRLGGNKLEGAISFEIGHLAKLTELDLSYNNLNGTVSPSLGQLEKLQSLDISGNSFAGELTEIHFAKLTELKSLLVSGNHNLHLNVSSRWFPPFQLREISLGDIQVGPKFPPWLETQKRVAILEMYNARISDRIPNWFEDIFSRVGRLDISGNQIIGKAPQIKGVPYPSLDFPKRYINMGSNKFDGSLNSIPKDTYMVVMSSNFFTGDIPPLDANETYGLYLDNNGFTGNIPITICNQTNLQSLDLSNNHLSGEIPFCLGNLPYLGLLNLANNSLSGLIPGTLGNLGRSLQFLLLSENRFHGKLPSSLGNLTRLHILDLGNNQLSGTLPRWLGTKLQELSWLRLQWNNLSGSIPTEICQLSKLVVLNLAQNNLSGIIPRCFGNFTAMKMVGYQSFQSIYVLYEEKGLHLSNIIKGREHNYTVKNMLATSIALSENKVVGEIPRELMDLDDLQSLSLSNNHLHGRIPDKIGNLKRLESLDVSMNELSGPIPPSLATVDTLQYLNLSFNRLSGPIPEGNHFQTFDDKTIYEGNSGLCGKPVSNSCSDHSKPSSRKDGSVNVDEGESFESSWFYAGIGPGFAIGFVGVFSFLRFKKSWRYAYFGFVENLCSSIWDRMQ